MAAEATAVKELLAHWVQAIPSRLKEQVEKNNRSGGSYRHRTAAITFIGTNRYCWH